MFACLKEQFGFYFFFFRRPFIKSHHIRRIFRAISVRRIHPCLMDLIGDAEHLRLARLLRERRELITRRGLVIADIENTSVALNPHTYERNRYSRISSPVTPFSHILHLYEV